jgi:hypothetical protein
MRLSILRTLAATALLATAACNSESATGVATAAPTPASQGLLSGVTKLLVPTQAVALVRNTPLKSTVTASKVIGAAGGSFSLPGTGLTVTVAEGAVSGNTTFSATAYAGSAIGYDFAPHQTFAKPITLTQDFANTNAVEVIKSGSMPQVAYFSDKSLVNWVSGLASVTELVFSNVDVYGSKVSADVFHFSGYLMSSGKTVKK